MCVTNEDREVVPVTYVRKILHDTGAAQLLLAETLIITDLH